MLKHLGLVQSCAPVRRNEKTQVLRAIQFIVRETTKAAKRHRRALQDPQARTTPDPGELVLPMRLAPHNRTGFKVSGNTGTLGEHSPHAAFMEQRH